MAAMLKAPVALRAPAGARARATRGMTVKAAATKHWLPGTEPPAYLDGKMAGDYGACDAPSATARIERPRERRERRRRDAANQPRTARTDARRRDARADEDDDRHSREPLDRVSPARSNPPPPLARFS